MTSTASSTARDGNDATAVADRLARVAKAQAPRIAAAPAAVKNALLRRIAECLRQQSAAIVAANERDLAGAVNLGAALLERLHVGPAAIESAAVAVEKIAAQEELIGAIDEWRTMPSGIHIGKMRVPLGVILMIYESRPLVTVDAAALALKSGNAIILRGGSEARRTNRVIADCLATALSERELNDTVQLVADSDRAIVGALLARADAIDMVIPRGGRELITRVLAEAKMPVLKHLDGNCHIYVDKDADLDMAYTVIENAKTRRYGVCNAAESVLVHDAVAATALPSIVSVLRAKGVEIRACDDSIRLLTAAGVGDIVAADEDDWRREYLAPCISIKIVPSLDDAIHHINRYGSGHTDAIISNDIQSSWRFLREVDSSSVMVNASTAFADGGEYGLGAEVGISTNKLHARGPIGVAGLTTQKYVVLGDGQCRSS